MLRYNLFWDMFSLLSFPVILRHPFQEKFIDSFPGPCFQFVSFKGQKA